MLTWEKPLSTTDAQQETTGSLVPYLRLTKGDRPTAAWQTWFRDTFFDNLQWNSATFNGSPVEETQATFAVTVNGQTLGSEVMTVTYLPARADSHNAPSTWIHWSSNLRAFLDAHNLTGATVRLMRTDSGGYTLDINQ